MSVATIKGVALAPGVSLNGRLYTPAVIRKAVARARERLAGGQPLTMLTHHGAEDDSTRIVGRVTSISQASDGTAHFTAEIADTRAGRDIAALVTGDRPYLTGVSIRGWWLGDTRTVRQPDGSTAETADDLELDGLDFTKTPGVPAARVTVERAPGRRRVYESFGPVSVAFESLSEADRFEVGARLLVEHVFGHHTAQQQVQEAGPAPLRPLHEMSPDEFDAYADRIFDITFRPRW